MTVAELLTMLKEFVESDEDYAEAQVYMVTGSNEIAEIRAVDSVLVKLQPLKGKENRGA
jgi:hypothetical protein